MIYRCLVEPSFNQIWYGFRDTPDECYATNSIEGWILTFLVFILIVALLKILYELLMKSSVSKLFNLDLIEKINLLKPKESEIENIKFIEIFRLLIIVIIFAVIVFSLIWGIGLFSNYLAAMILNKTGWALS